jgi:hypothetical protein
LTALCHIALLEGVLDDQKSSSYLLWVYSTAFLEGTVNVTAWSEVVEHPGTWYMMAQGRRVPCRDVLDGIELDSTRYSRTRRLRVVEYLTRQCYVTVGRQIQS